MSDCDYERELIKVCFIGSSSIGKSSMVKTWVNDRYPNEDMPEPSTGFDVWQKEIFVRNQVHDLEVLDLEGKTSGNNNRALHYDGCCCVVICYAIDCEQSFRNVENYWLDELKENSDTVDVPKILLGLRADLEDERMVSYEDAKELMEDKENNIVYFAECSAKLTQNITQVFVEAADAWLIWCMDDDKKDEFLKKKARIVRELYDP